MLKEDLATFVSARNLVIGYGSFEIIWALLHQNLESLYRLETVIGVLGKDWRVGIRGTKSVPFHIPKLYTNRIMAGVARTERIGGLALGR